MRFETAMSQMAENCKRDLPWFIETNAGQKGDLVVVAGGPSVRTRLKAIRKRKREGACVLACNGARKMLVNLGIRPDIVSILDMSPATVGFVDDQPDEAIYLVGSIVHPSLLDALKGKKVILWHPEYPDTKPAEAIFAKYPHKPCSLIGGGNTVGVRSLYLGHLMGFRTIHVYGLDSSYADDGADHAYRKHDGEEPDSITIMFHGKHYRCSPWMANQADEFPFYYGQLMRRGCKIVVHGDGLLPHVWREARKAAA